MAVDVCEQAGQPFYYSTRTDGQQVTLHHGRRLVGTMTADDIRRFCREHDVRLIVDASHPFAEGLHESVAAAGLPVVRIDRQRQQPAPDLVWCADFEEALVRLAADPPRRLLALTGVNTIARLKPFWQQHSAVFRILDREESRQQAADSGLTAGQLVFYDDHAPLPTAEQERMLMEQTGCDAVITKESGASGVKDMIRTNPATGRTDISASQSFCSSAFFISISPSSASDTVSDSGPAPAHIAVPRR